MSKNAKETEAVVLNDEALDRIDGGRSVGDTVYSALNKQRGGAQMLDLAKRNSLSIGLET